MTLIEAIKSGRPFRRKGEVEWGIGHSDGGYFTLTLKDICADDWEVKEPTVTITASQFWEACEKVKVSFRTEKGYEDIPLTEAFIVPTYVVKERRGPMKRLAEELGLEPK